MILNIILLYSFIIFFIGNLIVDDQWPEKGEITFDKVSLRYDSHLDPVVTEASFTINAGEKVMSYQRLCYFLVSMYKNLFPYFNSYIINVRYYIDSDLKALL